MAPDRLEICQNSSSPTLNVSVKEGRCGRRSSHSPTGAHGLVK